MDLFFTYVLSFFFMCETYALSVEERLAELERVVAFQSVVLEKHEHIIDDQKTTIKWYEKENADLKTRVQSLEEKMSNTSTEWKYIASENKTQINVHLNDAIVEQEMEVDNGNGSQAHGNNTAAVSLKIVAAIQTRMTKRPVYRQSNGIAFHAHMSGPKCFHNHEVFVFDVEEVDLGNGYSTLDGIYVAPVNGYYVFVWTFGSEWDAWFRSDIIVNGVSSGWITAAVKSDSSVSGTVMVHLNTGDHVFIRRADGTSCTVPDDLTRSTFSGWKLF